MTMFCVGVTRIAESKFDDELWHTMEGKFDKSWKVRPEDEQAQYLKHYDLHRYNIDHDIRDREWYRYYGNVEVKKQYNMCNTYMTTPVLGDSAPAKCVTNADNILKMCGWMFGIYDKSSLFHGSLVQNVSNNYGKIRTILKVPHCIDIPRFIDAISAMLQDILDLRLQHFEDGWRIVNGGRFMYVLAGTPQPQDNTRPVIYGQFVPNEPADFPPMVTKYAMIPEHIPGEPTGTFDDWRAACGDSYIDPMAPPRQPQYMPQESLPVDCRGLAPPAEALIPAHAHIYGTVSS